MTSTTSWGKLLLYPYSHSHDLSVPTAIIYRAIISLGIITTFGTSNYIKKKSLPSFSDVRSLGSRHVGGNSVPSSARRWQPRPVVSPSSSHLAKLHTPAPASLVPGGLDVLPGSVVRGLCRLSDTATGFDSGPASFCDLAESFAALSATSADFLASRREGAVCFYHLT